MCIYCPTATVYVLTLQGALFDTETGLVKLRRPAVYMNIIPTIYVWQKFCLNLLCKGFPMKCVKLKLCSLLFMCTEWITCSRSCLVLRVVTHTLISITALSEFGPLSSISIRAGWVSHYCIQFSQRIFTWIPPVINLHCVLIRSYCCHKAEGVHWIFTLCST